MTTWLTANDVDLIAELWADAPIDDVALGVYLAAAKAACVAYAPARKTEEGTIAPGPVTVYRRNLALNPELRANNAGWSGSGSTTRSDQYPASGFSWVCRSNYPNGGSVGLRVLYRLDGLTIGETYAASIVAMATAGTWAVMVSEDSNALNLVTLAPNYMPGGVFSRVGGTFVATATTMYVQYRSRSTTTGTPVDIAVTGIIVERGSVGGTYFMGSTPPVTVGDVLYSHAWEGAENLSPSVETYRPNVFLPSIPDEWVLAQVMQARNLWNAGAAGPTGSNDGSGFGLSTFPLDWQVQQLLRPRRGMGVIL